MFQLTECAANKRENPLTLFGQGREAPLSAFELQLEQQATQGLLQVARGDRTVFGDSPTKKTELVSQSVFNCLVQHGPKNSDSLNIH